MDSLIGVEITSATAEHDVMYSIPRSKSVIVLLGLS